MRGRLVTRPGKSKHGGGISNAPSVFIQSVIDGLLDYAELSFYAGTKPANTSTAPSGVTLLGTLTMASPAAPLSNLVSPAQIRLDVVGGYVYVTGSATFARLRSADAATVYDCDMSLSAGLNAIVTNSLSWTALQTITAVSIYITEASGFTQAAYLTGQVTIS